MAFYLDVGTDLYGVKQNTRLEFAACPSIAELICAAEAHFDIEARGRRPIGVPETPFKISSMQVYDDVLLRWVNLYSPAQLRSGGQVFVFQPESVFHSDAPGTIPPAKYAPESWLGSPARVRAAADAGVTDPVLSEKLRRVFYELDSQHLRSIPYTTLRDYFLRYDLPWSVDALGDYYARTGSMSYEDWCRFAARYPTYIDSLYYRAILGSYADRALYTSAAEEMASQRRAREAELRSYYEQRAAERAALLASSPPRYSSVSPSAGEPQPGGHKSISLEKELRDRGLHASANAVAAGQQLDSYQTSAVSRADAELAVSGSPGSPRRLNRAYYDAEVGYAPASPPRYY
eukprot:TRINITY_DN17556_c0_g1_i1.p1 TRINITY_DN17556_c0_g1~~TRINITY_DN17556_c0_g1_i1.p1  ORF type:complete len:347 (+),score=127.20 TRINITY_DN17556_c0_g1_i1:78-1118(+)